MRILIDCLGSLGSARDVTLSASDVSYLPIRYLVILYSSRP
jgi:hypothetical protein